MYDLKMLEEIKSQEERIHFSSFDYNDAYTLGTMLRERGLTTPKPIAIRIVFDDIILYQSFLPGTDESNNQWMNRKQHTVERCHTSSLRAAVERELNGAKENWQQDESLYAFCGGGFPIIVNNEFQGRCHYLRSASSGRPQKPGGSNGSVLRTEKRIRSIHLICRSPGFPALCQDPQV